jgi:dipeptidyl aminopeptidase/acylaminoacyl peptidase
MGRRVYARALIYPLGMRGHVTACCIVLGSCGGPAGPAVTVPAPPVSAQEPPAPEPPPAPAPPPAPDPVEAKVRAMAQIRRAGSPSFSPDGARLAFVSDAGGLPEVYVVAAAGGTPERVTKLSDPVGDVAWSPDGAWLAFSVAPGGGMNEQIYLARPDGSDLQRITDGGQDNNWLGDWTHDGQALALASNRRAPAAMDAYLFEPGPKKLGLVAKNPGIGSLSGVTRDRKRALLDRMKDRGNNDLYLVDLARGAELLLTKHDGPALFSGRFSPDGKAIYVAGNKDRDRAAISKVEYGDPALEADLLAQLSPIHKIDRIVTPVIVLHGKNDTNVPVIEAEQVVENLRKRNVPVEYVLFPDEGHGWQKSENRIESTLAITRWFDRYLNGAR